MSFPLTGTLVDIPIAELLLEIKRAGESGVLEVVRGKLRKQVAFSKGCPVAIQSNAMSESLLKLLESARRISSEDVPRLRHEAVRTKQALERLLVGEGPLKKEELPKLKAALSQLRLVGLYAWTEGTYRFTRQKVPAAPELPVPAAILQFVRRMPDAASLLRSLEPRRRERPRAVDSPPFSLAAFELAQDELEFYESLDGKRELGEILAFSGIPPQQVARLIIAFSLSGMIEDAARSIPAPAGADRAQTGTLGVSGTLGGGVGGSTASGDAAPGSVPGPVAIAPPAPEGGSPAVAIAPPAPEGGSPAVAIAPPAPEGGSPGVIAAPPPAAAVSPGSTPAPALAGTGGVSPGGEGGEGSVGRYVMSGDVEAVKAAPEADPGSEGASSGLSIEDMIAEEVGELDEADFVPVKLEHDPLLDFNMSGFTPREREIANQFKETYVTLHKQNYFEMFGLDRRAKAADIRKAYFALAKEYHTDRLVKFPEPVQKLGTEIFNKIQKAYDTLTDPEAREKYVDATFYGKAHDEEAAIEEVQAVLQADRHFKTGIGLLNAGNLPGAHAAFARARDLYPKEPEYNACYGFTLFRMHHPRDKKKCEEAEKLLHTAIRQNPKLDWANLFLGRIYLAKNDPHLAARYFVRALKINPANLEAGRELQQLRTRREQKSGGLFSSFFGKFKK